ncbi:hypothetical protein WG66_002119 [Moniliophthora roreri]|nr:hypothetical protein WG66_002119 [Moniliophthora roreri]
MLSKHTDLLDDRTTPRSSSDRLSTTQNLRDVERLLEDCISATAELFFDFDKLAKNAEKCESSLGPIGSVPPELLCSIFELLCEKNELHPFIPCPAFTVSAVCHRWRQIALATPEMWTSIHINLSQWEDGHQGLHRITRMFMDRSKMSALQIKLYGNSDVDFDPVGPTLETLAKNSSRWSHIDLSGAPALIMRNEIFEAVRGNLPRLKYLSLPSEDVLELPHDLFADAPALCSVSYSPNNGDRLPMTFPFSRLTFMELRHSYSHDAVLPLQRCPMLEILELFSIGGYSFDSAVDFQVPRVNVPHVTALKVTVKEHGDILFTFAHLLLPQVSSIEISADLDIDYDESIWEDTDNMREIRAFFDESSCVVTSLHLHRLPISDTQLINLLAFTPMIHTLYVGDLGQADYDSKGITFRIANRTVTSAFLQYVTTKDDSSIAMPRLATLAVEAWLHDFDAGGLMEAVSSRSRRNPDCTSATLRSVEVTLRGEGDLPSKFMMPDSVKDAGVPVNISLVAI